MRRRRLARPPSRKLRQTKPNILWAYAEPRPSLFRLTAAYAAGISSNHPFVDANKRTALIVSFVFLDVNRWEVVASQAEAYRTILSLAAGKMAEDPLAKWFERNAERR
jgi:death-on-curing protein